LPSSGHDKHALHKSCERAKGVCGEIFLPWGEILNFPQESYILLLMKQHIILWRTIKEKTLGMKYSLEKNDFYDVLVNNEHVGRDVDTLRLRRSSVTWRRRRWRRYMNHHHHQPPSSLRTSPGKRGTIHPDHSGKKTLLFLSLSLFSLSKKGGMVVLPHGALTPQKNRLPHPIDKVFSQ